MKLGKLAAAAMMSAACLILPATAQETGAQETGALETTAPQAEAPPPAEAYAWLPTMSSIKISRTAAS